MQVLAVASCRWHGFEPQATCWQPSPRRRLSVCTTCPSSATSAFMHFTDCHAQLTPVYFREPNVNLGVGEALGRPPHIVGEQLLKQFYGMKPGTRCRRTRSATWTSRQAAKTYGKVGGFAHHGHAWSNKSKPAVHNALLLDGGDTWQGSATSLVDQRSRHGRRLQDAGREHDDSPTGSIHFRCQARARRWSRKTSKVTSNSWRKTSRPPTLKTWSSSPTPCAK